VAGRGRPKTTVEDKLKEKTFDLDVIKKLAIHGLTDKQLADILSVDVRTIHNWKKDPQFLTILQCGKDRADLKVVATHYKCCLGFYKEVEKVLNDGRIVKYKQYFPPNPLLIMSWEQNRMRDKWKQKWPEDDLNIGIDEVEGRADKLTDEEVKAEWEKRNAKH
jgi:hypothetical protein